MKKFLVLLALAGLAAVAIAEDGSGDAAKPVLYDRLQQRGFGRLLNLGCALRDVLQDRDFSDHAYKVIDTARAVFTEGGQCAKDLILTTLKDKENNLAKLVSVLRYGDPVNDIRDLFRISPSVFPMLLLNIVSGNLGLFSQINFRDLRTDFRQLARAIVDDCGGKKFADVQTDIDAMKDQIRAALDKQ